MQPKYRTCNIFVDKALDLPSVCSLSNNVFIDIMQCGSKFRSESVKDIKNPIWESCLTMNIYKNHPIYVIIKHDGFIFNTEIAHGIIDLRNIDFDKATEICIPLFDTRDNAIFKKGGVIGYLYVGIIMNY